MSTEIIHGHWQNKLYETSEVLWRWRLVQ